MASAYRVHPAIGVMRVGASRSGYFLAGESLSAGPLEIDDHGADTGFTGYKDHEYRMRRQAARFRVLEYEVRADGSETFVREITPDVARISWSVELAASKAAGREMRTLGSGGLSNERVVLPGTGWRNEPPPGFSRGDLVATVSLSVTGAEVIPAEPPQGKILGRDLYIGEARTDAAGRLLVLPGYGEATTWAVSGAPGADMEDFLNNPTWYDDIADGPVDARLFFLDANGQETPQDPGTPADGAWVVAAPPDFAPDTLGVVTLWDVAQDAWSRKTGAPLQPVTWADDIEPLLTRAAGIQEVNSRIAAWGTIRDRVRAGGLDNPGPAAATARRQIVALVDRAMKQHLGHITPLQVRVLAEYEAGRFTPGPDPARAPDPGAVLDRAVLDRCVGSGMFPGIEIGAISWLKGLWAALGRLTRAAFTDYDETTQTTLRAGSLGERMACPWHADFVECQDTWWPAQRPDVFRYDAMGQALNPPGEWHRGVGITGADVEPRHRLAMVNHFAQLGVLERRDLGSGPILVEVGRDDAL